MNKIERLIKYLDKKYTVNNVATTGSRYWKASRFNIRLSNHFSKGEDALELSIMLPCNSEDYVACMGMAVYSFASTPAVISFIECLEQTAPIISSVPMSMSYNKSGDAAVTLLNKELIVARTQLGQMQKLLKDANNKGRVDKKQGPLVRGLLRVKTK